MESKRFRPKSQAIARWHLYSSFPNQVETGIEMRAVYARSFPPHWLKFSRLDSIMQEMDRALIEMREMAEHGNMITAKMPLLSNGWLMVMNQIDGKDLLDGVPLHMVDKSRTSHEACLIVARDMWKRYHDSMVRSYAHFAERRTGEPVHHGVPTVVPVHGHTRYETEISPDVAKRMKRELVKARKNQNS